MRGESFDNPETIRVARLPVVIWITPRERDCDLGTQAGLAEARIVLPIPRVPLAAAADRAAWSRCIKTAIRRSPKETSRHFVRVRSMRPASTPRSPGLCHRALR
jgi:hypothetical protein